MIYNAFKNSANIAIINNIHILDEGVDLPECDSVYITQPNNNMDNLIQRMCRANRITSNKKLCYVYLWSKQHKVDKLLAHIFDKTDGYFKDKIFKFSFFGNNINTIKNNKIKNTIVNTKDNTKDDMVANTKDDTIANTIKNNNIMYYFCNDCSYFCIQISHFKDHIKTKTHMKKSKIIFDEIINYNIYKKKLNFCVNCKKLLMSKRSLEQHQNKCKNIIETNKNNIIETNKNNIIKKFIKDMSINII